MVTASAETQKTKESPEVLRSIEATKPLLQNMAEQILNTDKDRWNVIIGDDAGGRLPARFVHDLMKLDGRDMKTFFVTGSKSYRNANGAEPYEAYFQNIEDQLGEPLRPLVVTESVDTGSAIDFLKERLASHSSQPVEVATVAVTDESVDKVNFAGGVGAQESKDVWFAYESPAAKLTLGRRTLATVVRHIPGGVKDKLRSKTDIRIYPPTMNDTVGIYVDTTSEQPIARRADDRDGIASTDAYRYMDELAAEAYAEIHDKQTVAA